MHRSIDDSWRNRVHTNVILCIFHRETSRDRLEAALRDHRNRGIHSRYRMFGHRGRNADDASASFLREHLFNRELGDVDEAFQIDGGERFEVLDRIVGKGLGEEYTRVIDQRIN